VLAGHQLSAANSRREDRLKFKPCINWFSYFSVIIKQKTNWREKI